MAFYRKHFPGATALPKMHMFEENVVLFIKKWRVGCGMLGEQGAESIHKYLGADVLLNPWQAAMTEAESD